MLFDLKSDPDEFDDLGADPKFEEQRQRLYAHLLTWTRRMSQRVATSDEVIYSTTGKSLRRGIMPFLFDGTELPPELTEKIRGPARQKYTDQ